VLSFVPLYIGVNSSDPRKWYRKFVLPVNFTPTKVSIFTPKGEFVLKKLTSVNNEVAEFRTLGIILRNLLTSPGLKLAPCSTVNFYREARVFTPSCKCQGQHSHLHPNGTQVLKTDLRTNGPMSCV
jgi:hypothetical protein